MLARIHSIESMSRVDGPGIRYVIFMQGCNMKCKFCHNRDTWDINGGKEISVNELFNKIKNSSVYFGKDGGVTFSGGEPLLQVDFLIELCEMLKKENINIAIDTAGNFDITEKLQKLLALIDIVMIDIKHIDNERHKELTKRSNDKILKFIDYLNNNNIKMIIKIVYLKGITDERTKDKENLKKYITKLHNVVAVEILPYHEMGKYKWEELKETYEIDSSRIPTKQECEKFRNDIL